MGGTTDKAARIANEAIGKAKQGIGSVVGSDRLQAEGAAQETKGDTQKAAGDAKDAIKTSVNKVAESGEQKPGLRFTATPPLRRWPFSEHG